MPDGPHIDPDGRARLSNRREQVTRELVFAGNTYLVSAGLETVERITQVVGPRQRRVIREVFITGSKTGQDIRNIIEDASVVISLALQYGAPVSALARSIARVPAAIVTPDNLDNPALNTVAASVIGAVIDLLAVMEAEIVAGDAPDG